MFGAESGDVESQKKEKRERRWKEVFWMIIFFSVEGLRRKYSLRSTNGADGREAKH